jgi:hypothetical protein
MPRSTLFLALFTAAAALSPAWGQGAHPAPLASALAASRRAALDYALDLEQVTDGKTWRAHYDRSGVHLLEPSRSQLSGEVGRGFDRLAESFRGPFWCAAEDLGHAADFRLLHEDAASATYSFRPPGDLIRTLQGNPHRPDGKEPDPHIRGELTVDKRARDVTSLRLESTEPFDAIPLVRVEHMTLSVTCALAPNGRRYGLETASRVQVNAFGHPMDQAWTRRATNLAR